MDSIDESSPALDHVEPVAEPESAMKREYARFMDWLRRTILEATSADEAIALAQSYGFARAANFDGVYCDDAVEQKVEQLYLAEHGAAASAPGNATVNRVVLVASNLYDIGGHTPICLQWVRAQPMGWPHELVVTRSLTERNRTTLREAGCAWTVLASDRSAGVTELLRHCAGAGLIVLHTHPEDIVAAVAARIARASGSRVIFYNHADHRFSYGIRSADVVAEVSHLGRALNARSGRVTGESCWLGIPIEPPPDASPASRNRKSGPHPTVMASGSPWKFRPSEEANFGDFIDRLLAADRDVVIKLVGPDGKEPWWGDRPRRWGARVVFEGMLPRQEYLAATRAADVFVDSFPVTGGTAFAEAVLAGALGTGIPVSTMGYSACDALRVPTTSALVERVEALLRGDADQLEQVNRVRATLLSHQTPGAFKRRIEQTYRGEQAASVIPYPEPAGLDTHWFERDWEAHPSIEIIAPRTKVLPLAMRCRFLRQVLPLRHYLSFKSVGAIVARTVFNVQLEGARANRK